MFGKEKAKFTFKAVSPDLTFLVAKYLQVAETQLSNAFSVTLSSSCTCENVLIKLTISAAS